MSCTASGLRLITSSCAEVVSGCTALAACFTGAIGRKSPAPGLIGLTVAINKRIGLAAPAFERNGAGKNLRRFAEKHRDGSSSRCEYR
jgi:hypothetical protein